MMSSPFDNEVDVVVVGSGAGGMAAALTAHIEGLSVLLIEKTDRIGGSTAVSGGAVWAPLNAQAAGAGHPDSMDAVMSYLAQTVGDAAPAALQRRYVEACGAMIDYFHQHTALRLVARTYSPDYYSDRPGASRGGRSLDPAEFDGRALKQRFKELRDPLAEFVVLGGMMVNLTDVKHLLAITRSFASFRHGMKLLLRYASDRLRGHHRGTRLLLGNALAASLFKSVLDRGIPYWLEAPVQALRIGPAGVNGVSVQHRGKRVEIAARRGVVIATGGFPWDEALRAEQFPRPTGPWSMSPRDNRGDGLRLARQAGATLGSGHASPAFWTPVSVLQRADGSEVRYPHLVWDRAKPGLMAVNGAGRRFVNESTSYHEFVLAMYRSHREVPTIPAYLICDRDFIERWGLGLALPGGRPREHLVKAGYLKRADTLEALAQQLGIDADGLAASAAQFNAAAQAGRDDAFGKGGSEYNRYLGDPGQQPNACLGPLRQAPFYAVAVYPGDIGTACGIRCNENAQALDAQGQAIAGLYMAGNDMHSVMGGCYPGPGITLGPALTFGWLAGRHLAHTPVPLSMNRDQRQPAAAAAAQEPR